MQNNNNSQHIYTSILRDWLFLGCDRNMIMLIILIAVMTAFMSASIMGVVSALAIFITGFVTLRRMALIDPLWRQVYIKALHYRRFYFAKAPLHLKNPVKTSPPMHS